MGYPESVLAKGERVVINRHPHWKRLFWPVVVLVFGTALAVFVIAVVNRAGWAQSNPTVKNIVYIAVGVVWLIAILWLVLWPFINWWTTHFVITDRRVMFRHGVFTRSGIDIPIARINSVEFRHNLINRMLRTGTLVIESASDDPLEFHDIPRVEQVHSLLYHEVFDTLNTDEADSQSSAREIPPQQS
ncbi:MAG: hypothetical protein QOH60_512 [Mycobacterium sp.]|nr:hypothetical protein [Mycobacterium sp.]